MKPRLPGGHMEGLGDLKTLVGRLKEFWDTYSRNRYGMAGLIILLLFTLIAVFADYIAPYGEWELSVGRPFEPPSQYHLFGCDELGRDLFSLFIYGTRISLIIGVSAALLSTLIGGLVGILAGFLGGSVDTVLMRIVDALLAIPSIVLMIIFAAILGPSFTNIIIVIAILSWPPIARVVRAQVLSIKEATFIEAARALGASPSRIMFKHILPNVVPVLIANLVLNVSNAIIAEAALSFLGLGDPHHTSWGMILHYAYKSGAVAVGYWWYIVPPGLGILALVMAFVFIGYALNEILNPRLRTI